MTPRLSPRELDVMACLEEGLGTDATAVKLRIKYSTVRNHIANLMTKFGVNSRLELVAVARGTATSTLSQVEPVPHDQRAVAVLKFLIEQNISFTDTEAAAITKAMTQ